MLGLSDRVKNTQPHLPFSQLFSDAVSLPIQPEGSPFWPISGPFSCSKYRVCYREGLVAKWEYP